jgi:ABC-type dipeptide/oligopeptide/nickel transport system permease subunit
MGPLIVQATMGVSLMILQAASKLFGLGSTRLSLNGAPSSARPGNFATSAYLKFFPGVFNIFSQCPST